MEQSRFAPSSLSCARRAEAEPSRRTEAQGRPLSGLKGEPARIWGSELSILRRGLAGVDVTLFQKLSLAGCSDVQHLFHDPANCKRGLFPFDTFTRVDRLSLESPRWSVSCCTNTTKVATVC